MYQAESELPHHYCKMKQYCSEKCKYSYFRDTLYNIVQKIKNANIKHKIIYVDEHGKKQRAQKYILEEIEKAKQYINDLYDLLDQNEK